MGTITNDGSDIINRKIDITFISNDMKSLENYDIDSTVEWITSNNFKKVGLQFPDELLSISIPISLRLKTRLDCEFGIMGDTSYASCCVDEVGGEHFNVEAIVHYGNSCLTSTHRKIPVKYVFGSYIFEKTDLEIKVRTIKKYLDSEMGEEMDKFCVNILSDFRYISFSESVSTKLSEYGFCVHNSYPNLSQYQTKLSSHCKMFGTRVINFCENPREKSIVLFIGDNYDYSVKTILISMYHTYQNMGIFYPIKNEIENLSTKIFQFLRSRLHSVEVARVSKRVGLLIGSLSVENYLEIYDYLYSTMEKCGKLVYPMVVGKINANKLANFADLDVLVVVNCTESCLQFSDKKDDYYKPVITPYEMVFSCDADKFTNLFTMPYLTDFKDLLKLENRITSFPCGDTSEFSLLSGKVSQLNCGGGTHSDGSMALVSRLDSEWSVSSINRSDRSWFGLDPMLGQTEVSQVKEGRAGIAAGYANEIE